MSLVPAVTVYQPWASLIAIGAKPVEWRGWPAPSRYVGARIAIHAAARPIRIAEVRALLFALRRDPAATGLVAEPARALLVRILENPFCVPLAAVLCTVLLGIPRPRRALAPAFRGDSTRPDHEAWAWPLDDVRPLLPPQPARGAQGFWSVRLRDEELALG